MLYYLDTEFIERPGSIQLISIGIIDETGKHEYYAISSEFNPEDASQWVKDNVIANLEPEELVARKSLQQIRDEIISYIEYTNDCKLKIIEDKPVFVKNIATKEDKEKGEIKEVPLDKDEIQFWGAWSDYDWVVFCWIFGKMNDLPKGMPMYCKDLIQEKDLIKLPEQLVPSQKLFDRSKAEDWLEAKIEKEEAKLDFGKRFNRLSREAWIEKQRNSERYRSHVSSNEHNALFDAKWNRFLHRALITYEAQIKSEKEMKEWQDLSQEMTIALKTYEARYNNANQDTDRIELTLKLNETNVADDEFVGKASLVLMIKELGNSPRIIANKVFAFHTQEQMNAKYDWGLKLYREMLHEITGASIIFSQAVEKEKRDMKELGGQDNL